MVPIAAIAKCDLWRSRDGRNLSGMGQDMTKSESLDQVSGSSLAASRTLRYSRTAIALHWAIAVLIVLTIPLGWYGATFPKDELARSAKDIHKSIGILILALTLVRVGWRVTHRPPALPDSYAPALRQIAKATHALFYVLLLVMPLSGWWMSSAVPVRHPIGFGPVDVPYLPVPRGWASAGGSHAVHVNLAWLMIGLVALHILAALKHQFVDKDTILTRMLPFRA